MLDWKFPRARDQETLLSHRVSVQANTTQTVIMPRHDVPLVMKERVVGLKRSRKKNGVNHKAAAARVKTTHIRGQLYVDLMTQE
jgi:hypothetical protein